jgi:transposase
MPLSKRTFSCDKCGLKLDRDVNAALNIYSRAGQARTHTPVDRFASVSFSSGKETSKLEEAGTICTRNKLNDFKN